MMGAMSASRKHAQLEAEIAEALSRPIVEGGGIRPDEDLWDFALRVDVTRKTRQKRLHQALLRHPALIVVDGTGRRTLLISSGEMSNPEEGARRVTMFHEDGPVGHVTRRSVTQLAGELSRDLAPVTIRPTTEDEVMAWMSTPEYTRGAERVLEVQRLNRGDR